MSGAIDFQAIADALVSWVTTSTGLQTVWENQKRPYIRTAEQAIAILSLLPLERVGVDEQRIAYNSGAPVGSQMEPTYGGNRILTVTLRVESMRQSFAHIAAHHLECARVGLIDVSIQAALQAAGLAMIDTSAIINLDGPIDDRIRSIAAFDTRFNLAACITGTAFERIAQVQVQTDTLDNVDGTPLPPSVQVDLDITTS